MKPTDMLELTGFIFIILNMICAFFGSFGAFKISRRKWNYAWISTMLAAFLFAAFFRGREYFEPEGIHPMQVMNTLGLFAWIFTVGLLCRIMATLLESRIRRRWLLGFAIFFGTWVSLVLFDKVVSLALFPILPRAFRGYYFVNTQGIERLNSAAPLYVLAFCLLIAWGMRRHTRLLAQRQALPVESGKDHEGPMQRTLLAQ